MTTNQLKYIDAYVTASANNLLMPDLNKSNYTIRPNMDDGFDFLFDELIVAGFHDSSEGCANTIRFIVVPKDAITYQRYKSGTLSLRTLLFP